MVKVYKVLGNLTTGTTSILLRFVPKTTIICQYASYLETHSEDVWHNLHKMQPGQQVEASVNLRGILMITFYNKF